MKGHKKVIILNDEQLTILEHTAKEQQLSLATYIRQAALKHSQYLSLLNKKTADDYFKYQFNDNPSPLSERMNNETLQENRLS